MADLFTVTAPLMIRCPGGDRRVMAELFRHAEGLLYFELYWNRMPAGHGVHVIAGELRGDGPWKIGDCVITLLGCQGSEPELAGEYAGWRQYLEQCRDGYPAREELEHIARRHGAITG
jgi:hypothetical protein